MDKELKKLYLIIFSIGAVFEPLWGLYMNMTQGGLDDPLWFRALLGLLCLGIVFLLKYKKEHFNNHHVGWLRFITIAYTMQRYYLVYLNDANLHTVIDLYTIVILGSVVTQSKKDLYIHAFYVTIPSFFFPQEDYLILFNLITILPLIGALKYTYFKHLNKLKEMQKYIKEESFEKGILKIMNATSHEVNNRLAKINLQTELLKFNYTDKEDLKKLSIIENEAYGIAEVYKFYSIIESGRNPKLLELDTMKILTDTQIKFNDNIKKNNIKLNTLKYCDGKLNTCPNILKIVLEVIYSNAIYELCKLDKDRELTINTKKENNYYYIEIEDSAGTLKESEVDKYFSPLYSNKDINDGKGMGLSLARSLAKKVNIEIKAFLRNKRTVFRIIIPD